MTHARILDELSQTAIELLLREPFYAHLFGSITKELVSEGHPVDTLAIGAGHNTLTLFVNTDFWDHVLTDPQHRVGVVKHEMLHLIFRHQLVREAHLDPRLLNIAFDLVVNQYIDRRQLPEDSIFLEAFPDLHLLPGQTWYYYYQKLQDLQQGKGGAFAGTPSAEMLETIRSDSHGQERHQPWREIRSRTNLEKNVLDVHLDSLLRSAHMRTNAAAWGNLPGSVRESIEPFLHPPAPAFNWKLLLRLFARSAARTRLQNTIRRPSRRYGTAPGIKIRRRQRLMVAIDTSGSIGQEEFRVFFGELFHLWRAGAEIDVLECDTAVHHRYPYLGRTPAQVAGRGGTRYHEPLELANREKPDGFIYFTDGYAEAPGIEMRVPTLWLITPAGLEPSSLAWKALPGRKLKMGRSGAHV